MMHITNLSLIRQKKVLLHPTSFIIEPNKLYALIGHNGSGKSSLIKALAGEMTMIMGRGARERANREEPDVSKGGATSLHVVIADASAAPARTDIPRRRLRR